MDIKRLMEIEEILHGIGLDFGMAFDETGNLIPGSGASDGANNLGDIKRDEQRICTGGRPLNFVMRHLKAHGKLGRIIIPLPVSQPRA
jgi:hypothetical protein